MKSPFWRWKFYSRPSLRYYFSFGRSAHVAGWRWKTYLFFRRVWWPIRRSNSVWEVGITFWFRALLLEYRYWKMCPTCEKITRSFMWKKYIKRKGVYQK